MTPQNTPSEAPKLVPAAPPVEPALAEPPKGVEFVEAPTEPETPTQAGTVTQQVVVNAPTKKATKKQPKTGPKGPALAITMAFILFAVLVGLAYYAYTKSN